MVKKEKVFKDISDHYSNKIGKKKPQKIVRKKLLQDIRMRVKNYSIVDWTDFTSCCYEFKILLHKGQKILDDDKLLIQTLNGERNDLRIFISSLGQYFYMFVEKTRYSGIEDKWYFYTIEEYESEIVDLINTIRDYLLGEGYDEIPKEYLKLIVPGVETELKNYNEANVFECLFTDLVTIS